MSVTKKYQVFISSTYTDLVKERKAVEETILRAGDIPVGMESFPAADEEQFEFIKTIIDSCDYYVLIIAGRYGSLSGDGRSYTEKEYDYATASRIPVLGLIHQDPESLPQRQTEPDPVSRDKLAAFKNRVAASRIVKYWENPDALKLAVREALDHAKATKPRPGWIRGDSIASEEALNEIAQLSREKRLLEQARPMPLEATTLELPELHDEVTVQLLPTEKGLGAVAIRGSWSDLFGFFQPGIDWRIGAYSGSEQHYYDTKESCVRIGRSIEAFLGGYGTGLYSISEESFRLLESYFIEVGLMREPGEEPLFSEREKMIARRLFVSTSTGTTTLRVVEGDFAAIKDPF